MTAEEQRAPIAFMTVHVDGHKDLTLAKPAASPEVGVVELVDRELLMHFVRVAEKLGVRVKEMESAEAYRSARHTVDLAKEEIDRLDDLILTMETRRAEVQRLIAPESDEIA